MRQRDGASARSSGVVDQLLDEKEPLCEDEQEQLVQEFELMHIKQSRQYRRLFGFAALGMASFFAMSAYQQHLHPFSQRFTAEFQTVAGDKLAVTVVLMLQGLALLASGMALLWGMPKTRSGSRGCLPSSLLTRGAHVLGLTVALASGAFWGRAMYAMIHRYGYKLGARWSLLWLPLGPFIFCFLCWYVAATLDSSGAQVLRMRRFKYSHKKV